jgi:hypothetical protein
MRIWYNTCQPNFIVGFLEVYEQTMYCLTVLQYLMNAKDLIIPNIFVSVWT